CSHNVRGKIIHRTVNRGNYVADAGKMKDKLDTLEKRIDGLEVADIFRFNNEPGIAFVVGQVLQTAAEQVVDHMDAMPLLEQQVHHVTADESRPSRDHRKLLHAHLRPRFFTVRTLINWSSLRVLPGNFPDLNALHKSRTAS